MIINVKRDGKKSTQASRVVGKKEGADLTQGQAHHLLKLVDSSIQMKRQNFILNKLQTTILSIFKIFSNRNQSSLSKGKKYQNF